MWERQFFGRRVAMAAYTTMCIIPESRGGHDHGHKHKQREDPSVLTMRSLSDFDLHLDRFASTVQEEARNREASCLQTSEDFDRILARLDLPLSQDEQDGFVPSSAAIDIFAALDPPTTTTTTVAATTIAVVQTVDDGTPTQSQDDFSQATPDASKGDKAEASHDKEQSVHGVDSASGEAKYEADSAGSVFTSEKQSSSQDRSESTTVVLHPSRRFYRLECRAAQAVHRTHKLRITSDNSEEACAAECYRQPECAAFDYMMNPQADACRMYGTRTHTLRGGGPGHRHHCFLERVQTSTTSLVVRGRMKTKTSTTVAPKALDVASVGEEAQAKTTTLVALEKFAGVSVGDAVVSRADFDRPDSEEKLRVGDHGLVKGFDSDGDGQFVTVNIGFPNMESVHLFPHQFQREEAVRRNGQDMLLPGNVSVGEEVVSRIRIAREDGHVIRIGDHGIVKGLAESGSGKVSIQFEQMKDAELQPTQFIKNADLQSRLQSKKKRSGLNASSTSVVPANTTASEIVFAREGESNPKFVV